MVRHAIGSGIDKAAKLFGSSGLSHLAALVRCKKSYLDELANSSICQECPAVLKIACKLGVNINDINGVNALNILPINSTKMLQTILDMGVDVNTKDLQSRTLLHRVTEQCPDTYGLSTLTSYHNCPEMIRLLLKYGARVDIVDSHKKAPLTNMLLQSSPNLEAVKLLKEAGAVYDCSLLTNGRTLLEDAIYALQINRVKACILAGAKCENFIGTNGTYLLNWINIMISSAFK